jgi:hypothetical protein
VAIQFRFSFSLTLSVTLSRFCIREALGFCLSECVFLNQESLTLKSSASFAEF